MSAANGETLVSAINRLLLRLNVRGVSANEIVACIKPLIDDSEAMDDYASIKDLQRELATERGRLDWLESPAGVDWQWSSSALTIRRAVIDAAMKEDAK